MAVETVGSWYWIADEIEAAGMALTNGPSSRTASRRTLCCVDSEEMTPPTRLEQRGEFPKGFPHNGRRGAAGHLGLPSTPIGALHLVAQDHAAHGQPIRQGHFKGVSLYLRCDWAQ